MKGDSRTRGGQNKETERKHMIKFEMMYVYQCFIIIGYMLFCHT